VDRKAAKNDAELRGVRPEFLGALADWTFGFDRGLSVRPARGLRIKALGNSE
jgi:hypothetical protein